MSAKCWVCGRGSYWQLAIPSKTDRFKTEHVEVCKDNECMRLTNLEITNRKAQRRKTDLNHVGPMDMGLKEWEQEVADIVRGDINTGVDKALGNMSDTPVQSKTPQPMVGDTIIDHFMAAQLNCPTDEKRGEMLRNLSHQELTWLNDESNAIYPKIRHRAAPTIPDSLEEEFGMTSAQMDWVMQVNVERKGKD